MILTNFARARPFCLKTSKLCGSDLSSNLITNSWPDMGCYLTCAMQMTRAEVRRTTLQALWLPCDFLQNHRLSGRSLRKKGILHFRGECYRSRWEDPLFRKPACIELIYQVWGRGRNEDVWDRVTGPRCEELVCRGCCAWIFLRVKAYKGLLDVKACAKR